MLGTLVAGVDSSTQSTTVVLRRLIDGRIVGEARAPHPPTTPPRSEQDPESWWNALTDALIQLRSQLDKVMAISVGGQGHGLVLLNEDNIPLRPAKLWNDTEPAPDAERLRGLLSPAAWAERTGSVPGPALTVSKLAWTERCCPGLVAQAAQVMLPADYIVYRLSGKRVTERGGCSGTGYFNPFSNQWDLELVHLAAPAVRFDQLPAIIESTSPAAEITQPQLRQLHGAVVGAGTGDNMAAALGLGIEEGDIVISLGTSGTVYTVTPLGVKDASGAINGYADATGRFMPMVTTLNAAKVTDCFRRLLGVRTDEFDALALEPRRADRAPVLIPYLDGERTPDLPDATGRLLYLRSDSMRAEIARAAVEGVLCGLLEGLDLLAKQGIRLDGRLILTGGAARSRAFRQILSDLTGKAVWIAQIPEAAAAGAAVQAAAALSGEDISKIARRWAPELKISEEPEVTFPREAVRESYRIAIESQFGRHQQKRGSQLSTDEYTKTKPSENR